MNLRKKIKDLVKRMVYSKWPEVPFDNNIPWLGYTFQKFMDDPLCSSKPMYLWGVLQGVALAKVLGFPAVSVIEFGVAGGAGLLSLEYTSERVSKLLGVDIFVYGFDSGVGLPKPEDYRDQPNLWFEGQFSMKQETLQQKLQKASLRIGFVEDTIQDFLLEKIPPLAFASIDVDLYSSTRDAFAIFDAPSERLLPRVLCYFDDIFGHTYNDFSGERLAIAEFNSHHNIRKLSPLYGLRHFVPREFQSDMYWDAMYYAHLFDHELYNSSDSIRKIVYIDEHGNNLRRSLDSDWRSNL